MCYICLIIINSIFTSPSATKRKRKKKNKEILRERKGKGGGGKATSKVSCFEIRI